MTVTIAVILNTFMILVTTVDNIVLGLMGDSSGMQLRLGWLGGEEAADVSQHVQPSRARKVRGLVVDQVDLTPWLDPQVLGPVQPDTDGWRRIDGRGV